MTKIVEWQEDGIHKHPADEYSLKALRHAAKDLGIKLSQLNDGKRHNLTKKEIIAKLVESGEVFAMKPDPKPKKKLTEYNIFIKNQIARLKNTHEGIKHKQAFKKAAENWTKENPKTAKEPKEPKSKIKKEPNAYNKWVSDQIKRIKEEEDQKDHKAAFKKAIANYKKAHPKEIIFTSRQKKMLG
jgi:NACalpha-BTF3-like transcription factor